MNIQSTIGPACNQARLSDRTFGQFSEYIHAHYGIKLPPAKKIMLESRLRKRLRDLKLSSFEAYAEYVFHPNHAAELVNMADAVSTNKTDFFREPHHFTELSDLVLPDLLRHRIGRARPLQVWSAACSTGEEPYTLAMVISEFAEKNPGFDFRILGTDLSTEVLEHAIRAIYAERRVDPIELFLRKKYLLRSRNPQASTVRIIPKLRDAVRFQRLNFLEDPYPKDQCMDVIFCRNVLIYFDRDTQQEIVGKMCATLRPGGYLFIGHSETLNGLNLPVHLVKSTLYRKI